MTDILGDREVVEENLWMDDSTLHVVGRHQTNSDNAFGIFISGKRTAGTLLECNLWMSRDHKGRKPRTACTSTG
jgi:hypothetical protein